MGETMKKCFKCGCEKEQTEFYKHPDMEDGYLGKCKDCTKKDVKNRYYSKITEIKDYEHHRSQTKQRKQKAIEYLRTKRAKYPEKYQAHNIVSNAVRDGRLEKQSCEICGCEQSQAHHEDYSRPLDVRWLCFKHHRKIHGQLSYEA